ncbi:hypothetical protein, partial [Thiolapillus sp.]
MFQQLPEHDSPLSNKRQEQYEAATMTVAPGSHQITPVITHFLTERLQPKLDKLKESDEEKR